MKCEICGRGPKDGISVYRQNATGERGRWRCQEHNRVAIDPDVKRLVGILEKEPTDGE